MLCDVVIVCCYLITGYHSDKELSNKHNDVI